MGIIGELGHIVSDKRASNASIPPHVLRTLAITAKMKVKTSVSGIPYAIEYAALPARLGWNLSDRAGGIGNGLMDEGGFRRLFGNYTKKELVDGYNTSVQQRILPKAGIGCTVHLPDCTRLTVKLSNTRYGGSTVVKDEAGAKRGYKPATLRGIAGDGGV